MEEHAVYRVLMVEDDRGIAQAVQTQGELWNLQVRQVQDLRHVMEEFAAFDPHLVLLDIGLPCFDGYHWCTEIRRVSRVPVIFISSAADNMNIIMAMNLGADDFIAKPFDQSVLMAKIQALLRRTYDFGASAPVLEHRGALLNTRGQHPDLSGPAGLPDQKRIPHSAVPDAEQGPGGEPGEAHGAPVGNRQLRGREHPHREHRPSAEKAGRRRSAGVHHHPGGPGLYGGVRAMLTGYLRQRRRTLLAFFLFGGIFAAAFALYQLPLRAVAYPFVLCAAAGAVLLTLDYRRVLRQHRRLELLRQLPEELADALPPADTVKEADYRSLVTLLAESRRAIRTQEEQRYGDMVDYYTMWAHQIKTPIASMRLTLQNEDSDLARSLSGDLMRVEQYVEMVLVFLRLDSSTTDYVIRSHSLDDIVRPAVRKFAGEFIRRRLRLDYQPLDRTVVTDAKWLGFVVEQVLSNALKYTVSGSVTIAMDGDDLCIRDTGMGIAPEDLPRIFDRGFTGLNGRRDTRASGIGLYLCRRICRSLGHTIRASSVPNQGTEIRIGLGQKKTLPE